MSHAVLWLVAEVGLVVVVRVSHIWQFLCAWNCNSTAGTVLECFIACCTKGTVPCFTIVATSAAVYTDGSRKGFPVSMLVCRLYKARSRMESVLTWDSTCENDVRQRTRSLGPKRTNATRLGGTSRKGCSCMLASWCLVHSTL